MTLEYNNEFVNFHPKFTARTDVIIKFNVKIKHSDWMVKFT